MVHGRMKWKCLEYWGAELDIMEELGVFDIDAWYVSQLGEENYAKFKRIKATIDSLMKLLSTSLAQRGIDIYYYDLQGQDSPYQLSTCSSGPGFHEGGAMANLMAFVTAGDSVFVEDKRRYYVNGKWFHGEMMPDDVIQKVIEQIPTVDASLPLPFDVKWNATTLKVIRLSLAVGRTDLYLVFLDPLDRLYKGWRTALLECVATGGDIEIYRLVMVGYSFDCSDALRVVKAAAKGGHIEIVRLALDHVIFNPDDNYSIIGEFVNTLQVALTDGRNDIVQMLMEVPSAVTIKSTAARIAADKGLIDILRLLLDRHNFEAKDMVDSLAAAARQGDIEMFQLILDRHSFEAKDMVDSLAAAAINGHIDVFQLILDRFTFDAWNPFSVLKKTAENGHFNIVHLLCGRFDYFHWLREFGEAAKEHVDVVRVLFDEARLDVDKLTAAAEHIADRAALYGHFDTVQLLVDRYNLDSQNLKDTVSENIGDAAYHGHIDIARRLIERWGLDSSALFSRRVMQRAANFAESVAESTAKRVAAKPAKETERQAITEVSKRVDKTALVTAACDQDFEEFRRILQNDRDLTPDDYGEALVAVCYENSNNRKFAIVGLLLEKGADVNFCTTRYYENTIYGNYDYEFGENIKTVELFAVLSTPLLVAVLSLNLALVGLLWKKGADINQLVINNGKEQTLLYFAMSLNSDLAKFLEDKGAKLTEKEKLEIAQADDEENKKKSEVKEQRRKDRQHSEEKILVSKIVQEFIELISFRYATKQHATNNAAAVDGDNDEHYGKTDDSAMELYTAIMTGDLPKLQSLLTSGQCDVNAVSTLSWLLSYSSH